jgi:hypothetical protein
MKTLNLKLGGYASLVAVAHLLAGVQLGMFYRNPMNSSLDNAILRVIDWLHYLKDLF